MNDAVFALVWIGVLTLGVTGCVLLHRWGLATTYVRDLLHVGTGIWVFGWPLWSRLAWPLAIVLVALAATMVAPVLARHSSAATRVMTSFAAGDERWEGLVLYAASFAALTAGGLTCAPFPAAAGLLSLCLGDGIGGAVGRRFGRHRYRVPGGKQKSWEGSAVVAVAATAAALIAAWWFGTHLGIGRAAGLGLAAALAEALSPRGTDNVVLPVLVWVLAGAAGVV
jgi:phytol kinase